MIENLLIIIGTVCGIIYSYLGIKVRKNLKQGVNLSETEKTFGWAYDWCFDEQKYDDEGKKICRLGGMVLICGLISWVAFYYFINK